MRTLLLASAIVGGLGLAGAAMAESPGKGGDDSLRTGANVVNVPREQWQTPAQISDKLTAQGYKVHEVEAEDRAYEVKVTDKNGARLEMDVHPATGEFLPGNDD